jgi:hypothetical protein
MVYRWMLRRKIWRWRPRDEKIIIDASTYFCLRGGPQFESYPLPSSRLAGVTTRRATRASTKTKAGCDLKHVCVDKCLMPGTREALQDGSATAFVRSTNSFASINIFPVFQNIQPSCRNIGCMNHNGDFWSTFMTGMTCCALITPRTPHRLLIL